MFIAALFTIAKTWKQPKCSSKMDKENMWCINHNTIWLSRKKEWNSAICNNVHGLGGTYTKWYKSDQERQIFVIT